MTRRLVRVMALVFVLALIAGCAPGQNPQAGGADGLPGFWLGLWHGFIVLFTFIVSLFNKDVGIYEVVNSGGWYDFGFLLGVMTFWGGGGRGSGSRR